MGVAIFSPAKINLYLVVTGRRADGYHELVSVAALLDFGDEVDADVSELTVPAGWPAGVCPGQPPGKGAGAQFSLECDRAEVPLDDSNLVLKAARAFVAATGWDRPVAFKLTKRIPLGAGLGGGSSNAVAALRALNRLAGGPLTEARLAELAAALGSDCALFMAGAAVVMRGRGERIEALPGAAGRRLAGQRVLLFKPSFAINTAWAYGRMAARGSDYLPAAEAEARLGAWLAGGAPAGQLLFNNMEPAAFEKFVALPVLLARLRRDHGLVAGMSGSGSACFALLPAEAPAGPVTACIREAWGPAAFVQEARIV